MFVAHEQLLVYFRLTASQCAFPSPLLGQAFIFDVLARAGMYHATDMARCRLRTEEYPLR